jgi:hypothetical protein
MTAETCSVSEKQSEEIEGTVCEDGSYFILNYLYTHRDEDSEKKIIKIY